MYKELLFVTIQPRRHQGTKITNYSFNILFDEGNINEP